MSMKSEVYNEKFTSGKIEHKIDVIWSLILIYIYKIANISVNNKNSFKFCTSIAIW